MLVAAGGVLAHKDGLSTAPPGAHGESSVRGLSGPIGAISVAEDLADAGIDGDIHPHGLAAANADRAWDVGARVHADVVDVDDIRSRR